MIARARRSPRRAALLLAGLALASSLAACGYHPAHAPLDPAGPFHVIGGRARVPHAVAMAAAEEGARAELAREGQLASLGEGASIEIEILRVDDEAEGIALAAPDLPLGRSQRVTVTGRARMRGAGGAAMRDTGDVRASEVIARSGDAARALLGRDEAARSAARRLGERLVRRLLGHPEPSAP